MLGEVGGTICFRRMRLNKNYKDHGLIIIFLEFMFKCLEESLNLLFI